MRKHVLNIACMGLLAASASYAADAVPVPPEVKTTQIRRNVPCTVQQTEGMCEVTIKLEEFGLNNLTVNIITPESASPVRGARTGATSAEELNFTAAGGEPIFSSSVEPFTPSAIERRCGYSSDLAQQMVLHQGSYTVNERYYIVLYWNWEWYGWACSKLFAGSKRFVSRP